MDIKEEHYLLHVQKHEEKIIAETRIEFKGPYTVLIEEAYFQYQELISAKPEEATIFRTKSGEERICISRAQFEDFAKAILMGAMNQAKVDEFIGGLFLD